MNVGGEVTKHRRYGTLGYKISIILLQVLWGSKPCCGRGRGCGNEIYPKIRCTVKIADTNCSFFIFFSTGKFTKNYTSQSASTTKLSVDTGEKRMLLVYDGAFVREVTVCSDSFNFVVYSQSAFIGSWTFCLVEPFWRQVFSIDIFLAQSLLGIRKF